MPSFLQILACTHKPSPLIFTPQLAPIHVGRALAPWSRRLQLWRLHGDDSGDNISRHNTHYAELTALYWAWKNPAKLRHPAYIGLCHYRRFFFHTPHSLPAARPASLGSLFQYQRTTPVVSLPPDLFFSTLQDEYLHHAAALDDLTRKCDYIVPQPLSSSRTLHQEYAHYHPIADLDLVLQIVADLFPHMAATARQSVQLCQGYYCNMFIMRWALFQEYCQYLFSVLQAFSTHRDLSQYTGYQTRVLGFLGERLTNIFIQHLQIHRPQLRYQELPIIYLQDPPAL